MTERERQFLERLKQNPALLDSFAAKMGWSKPGAGDGFVSSRDDMLAPSTAAQDVLQHEDEGQKLRRMQEIQARLESYGGAPVIRNVLGRPSQAEGAFDVGKMAFAESLTGIPFTMGVNPDELEQHPVAQQVGGLAGFLPALFATRRLPLPGASRLIGAANKLEGIPGFLARAAAQDAASFGKVTAAHTAARALTGTSMGVEDEAKRAAMDLATGTAFGLGSAAGRGVARKLAGETFAPSVGRDAAGRLVEQGPATKAAMFGEMAGQSAAFAGTAAGMKLAHGETPTWESMTVDAMFGPVVGVMRGGSQAAKLAFQRIMESRTSAERQAAGKPAKERGEAVAKATRKQVAKELRNKDVADSVRETMAAADPVNGAKNAEIAIERLSERGEAQTGMFTAKNGKRYIVSTSQDEAGNTVLRVVDNKGKGEILMTGTAEKAGEAWREFADKNKLSRTAGMEGIDVDAMSSEIASTSPESIRGYAEALARSFATASQAHIPAVDAKGNPIPDNIAQPLKRSVRRAVMDRIANKPPVDAQGKPLQRLEGPEQAAQEQNQTPPIQRGPSQQADKQTESTPTVKIGDRISVAGQEGEHVVTGISKSTGQIIYAPNGDKMAGRKTADPGEVSVSKPAYTVAQKAEELPLIDKLKSDQDEFERIRGDFIEDKKAALKSINEGRTKKITASELSKMIDEADAWHSSPVDKEEAKDRIANYFRVNGTDEFDPSSKEEMDEAYDAFMRYAARPEGQLTREEFDVAIREAIEKVNGEFDEATGAGQPDESGKVVTLPGETEEEARARMAEDEIPSMPLTREEFAEGKQVEDQDGAWVRYDGPNEDGSRGYTIFDPNNPELQGKSMNEADLEKAGFRAFGKSTGKSAETYEAEKIFGASVEEYKEFISKAEEEMDALNKFDQSYPKGEDHPDIVQAKRNLFFLENAGTEAGKLSKNGIYIILSAYSKDSKKDVSALFRRYKETGSVFPDDIEWMSENKRLGEGKSGSRAESTPGASKPAAPEIEVTDDIKKSIREGIGNLDVVRRNVLETDVMGSTIGAQSGLDRLFDSKSRKEVLDTGRSIYDAFSGLREKLRSIYGDKIVLWRAQGKLSPIKNKHTLNFSTKDFSEQFINHGGEKREMVSQEVPIDDIVSAFISKNGKYFEFHVINRKSEGLVDPTVKSESEPVTIGGALQEFPSKDFSLKIPDTLIGSFKDGYTLGSENLNNNISSSPKSDAFLLGVYARKNRLTGEVRKSRGYTWSIGDKIIRVDGNEVSETDAREAITGQKPSGEKPPVLDDMMNRILDKFSEKFEGFERGSSGRDAVVTGAKRLADRDGIDMSVSHIAESLQYFEPGGDIEKSFRGEFKNYTMPDDMKKRALTARPELGEFESKSSASPDREQKVKEIQERLYQSELRDWKAANPGKDVTPEMEAIGRRNVASAAANIYDTVTRNLEKGDVGKLLSTLHSKNKNTRKLFEELSGVKIGSGKDAVKDAVIKAVGQEAYDKHLADQKKAQEEADAAKEQRRRDRDQAEFDKDPKLNGFLASIPDKMASGRAKKILYTSMRYNGVVKSRKVFVEESAAAGKIATQRRILTQQGMSDKLEWAIGGPDKYDPFVTVTKTEADYLNYLLGNKQETAAVSSKPQTFDEIGIERVTEIADEIKKSDGEVYVPPQLTINYKGKARPFKTGGHLRSLGLVPGEKENYWRKPKEYSGKPAHEVDLEQFVEEKLDEWEDKNYLAAMQSGSRDRNKRIFESLWYGDVTEALEGGKKVSPEIHQKWYDYMVSSGGTSAAIAEKHPVNPSDLPPWMMSSREYMDRAVQRSGTKRKDEADRISAEAFDEYQNLVIKAAEEGKEIPKEVLSEDANSIARKIVRARQPIEKEQPEQGESRFDVAKHILSSDSKEILKDKSVASAYGNGPNGIGYDFEYSGRVRDLLNDAGGPDAYGWMLREREYGEPYVYNFADKLDVSSLPPGIAKAVRLFNEASETIARRELEIGSNYKKLNTDPQRRAAQKTAEKQVDAIKEYFSHKNVVERALSSGRAVPDRVLIDHPDLAKLYGRNPFREKLVDVNNGKDYETFDDLLARLSVEAKSKGVSLPFAGGYDLGLYSGPNVEGGVFPKGMTLDGLSTRMALSSFGDIQKYFGSRVGEDWLRIEEIVEKVVGAKVKYPERATKKEVISEALGEDTMRSLVWHKNKADDIAKFLSGMGRDKDAKIFERRSKSISEYIDKIEEGAQRFVDEQAKKIEKIKKKEEEDKKAWERSISKTVKPIESVEYKPSEAFSGSRTIEGSKFFSDGYIVIDKNYAIGKTPAFLSKRSAKHATDKGVPDEMYQKFISEQREHIKSDPQRLHVIGSIKYNNDNRAIAVPIKDGKPVVLDNGEIKYVSFDSHRFSLASSILLSPAKKSDKPSVTSVMLGKNGEAVFVDAKGEVAGIVVGWRGTPDLDIDVAHSLAKSHVNKSPALWAYNGPTITGAKAPESEILRASGDAKIEDLQSGKGDGNPDLGLQVSFGIPSPQDLSKIFSQASAALRRQVARWNHKANFDSKLITGRELQEKMGLIEEWFSTPKMIFGAIPGMKPRLGKRQARAVRTILLAERDMNANMYAFLENMHDSLKKAYDSDKKLYEKFSEFVESGPGTWTNLPKEFREALESYAATNEQMRSLAKDHFIEKEVRAYIHAYYPDSFRMFVETPFEKIKAMQPKSKRGKTFKKFFDDVLARVEAKYDGWGVENFFHHLFDGTFQVRRYAPGQRDVFDVVGVGKSRAEAMALAEKDAFDSGGKYKEGDYSIENTQGFTDPILEITDNRTYKVTKIISDALGNDLSRPAVEFLLSGTAKSKALKSKFASTFKKRKGVEGYEKDPVVVMRAYARQVFRSIHLTKLSGIAEVAATELRARGQSREAAYLEDTLKYIWGRAPDSVAASIDEAIMRAPVVGDYVAPGFTYRLLRRTRQIGTAAMLKVSPRYHIVNSTQRLQTLLPDFPENVTWSEVSDWLSSPAGKAHKERHGVRYNMGSKFEDWEVEMNGLFYRMTSPKTREKMADAAPILVPEARNQEFAWATYYLSALKSGMSEKNANDYAFMKGNLASQFLHLMADQPKVLRNEWVKTFGGQWKSFMFKNIDFGRYMAMTRGKSAFTKWVAAQMMLGGMRPSFRMAATAVGVLGVNWQEEELRKGLQDQFGEKLGNMMFYGMPAAAGIDLSASFTMLDMPFGNTMGERVFNGLAGFTGTTAAKVYGAATATTGVEPSSVKRGVRAASEAVSGLRWINSLEAWNKKTEDGTYNLMEPDGQLRAAVDGRTLLMNAFGMRTIGLSEASMMSSYLVTKKAERSRLIDRIAIEGLSDSTASAVTLPNGKVVLIPSSVKSVQDWNENYPDFPITPTDIFNRQSSKAEDANISKEQRTRKGLPRAMRGYNQKENQ